MGAILRPRGRFQYLETFLFVTSWEVSASDIWYVEDKGTTHHPTKHRTAPQQRVIATKSDLT